MASLNLPGEACGGQHPRGREDQMLLSKEFQA